MPLKKKSLEKKIDCPRCWVEAERYEVDVFGPNIEIDECPRCRGIWLDPGELNKLLRDRKMTKYLTEEIGTQSKSKLVCPRCGGLMDIEKADDIEVDVCLSCRGVWLDAGELEDLKAKSADGFQGNQLEKAEERYEEMVKRDRERRLRGFLRR